MSPAPKKRALASSSTFITSSPMTGSAKRLRGRPAPAGSGTSARSLNSDLEGTSSAASSSTRSVGKSQSLSARARSIFSPVFSPVLSLFKKDSEKAAAETANTSTDSASERSISGASTASAESKSAQASALHLHEVPSPADQDAAESDPEYDDDFDDFDPFEFIKNLPAPSLEATDRKPVLPRKSRSSPPVSLVLDLDETLVHASLEYMEDSHLNFTVTFHSQDYQVWVKIRPHCQEFLERLHDKFELIVFTASQKIYADKLLDLIDPRKRLIKHRVFRDSCVLVHDNYVKDLTVLSRDLAQVAIIDNSPQAFGYQLSNGIPIKSWFGDTEDRCLLKLLPFLESFAGAEDVRPHIEDKFKLHERVAAA